LFLPDFESADPDAVGLAVGFAFGFIDVACDRGVAGNRDFEVGEVDRLHRRLSGHHAVDELGLVLDPAVRMPIAQLIGAQPLQLGFIRLQQGLPQRLDILLDRRFVAGLGERISQENSAGIPGLWHRFNQSVHNIPRRVGTVAYGVCCNGDDAGNFDYISGVEVSDFSDLPREFASVRIPEQRYAVFTHRDHISTIRRTVNTIWNHWLPASGLKAADAPNFERYDENFDPLTGDGGLEIWVPVQKAFSSEVGTGLREENAPK